MSENIDNVVQFRTREAREKLEKDILPLTQIIRALNFAIGGGGKDGKPDVKVAEKISGYVEEIEACKKEMLEKSELTDEDRKSIAFVEIGAKIALSMYLSSEQYVEFFGTDSTA